MPLADTDILAAVNGAGITTEQQLQDTFAIAAAFQGVLGPVATAGNTTVAALATVFAQWALLAMQIQQNNAAQVALQQTLKTQNNAGQAQQQALQATNAALTAQLAALAIPASATPAPS